MVNDMQYCPPLVVIYVICSLYTISMSHRYNDSLEGDAVSSLKLQLLQQSLISAWTWTTLAVLVCYDSVIADATAEICTLLA